MGAPGLPCEEGVSPPLRSSHGKGAPPLRPRGAISQCEGLRPSGASRQTWLLTPQVGASGPHDPHREGAPPLHPGELSLNARGFAPLHSPSGGLWPPRPPWGGRSAPPTPGDFPVAGKVTKGAPRAAPFGIPPVRGNHPLWCFASLAPGLLSATKKDRFATFRLWANRSYFSPLVLSRRYFLLSIRGAGVILPRRNPYYPSRRRWPDR